MASAPTATPSPAGAAPAIVNWKYLLPICLVATLGGLLFGYDTGVISGAIEPMTTQFALDSSMKGWASGCVLIGCAAGVLMVGPISDRFGRKLAMTLAGILFLVSSIGTSIPQNVTMFILFRILGGLGIGIASMSTPMYIAEITPGKVRGRLVAVNQIAIVSGLALVYFINYFIAVSGASWSGVPVPSPILAQTQKIHLVPVDLDTKLGTFTLACGSDAGIQTGMECLLALQPAKLETKPGEKKADDKKPVQIALATIGTVAKDNCQATVIPRALPNIDWQPFTAIEPAKSTPVAIILSARESWNIHVGWRWMFASGILPSILFLLLLIPIPESPRWLIENRQDEKANAILAKVGGASFADAETASIRDSLSQEKGTWSELFSKTLIVPLGFGIALAILQQVTGINVFMYFGTTIFNNMSASTGVDAGMLAQAIVGGSGVLFTVIAIASVDKWGRKPLMILGTTGMMISLIAMGVMAQTMTDPTAASGWMLAFVIAYIACFGLSVGPVVWVILSEIFPTAVRGRALGLATFCLWIADYAVTQTFPMMDQNKYLIDKYNHAFPFYVYAGFCVVLLAVMVFVPETKGKSLEEIEAMWRRRGEKK